MILSGTRFGQVEYETEDVIRIEGGLIGLEGLEEFLLLSHKPNSPFRWLQSVTEPAMALLVAIPEYFVPTYAPTISDADAKGLGLTEDSAKLLFATVNIPAGKPQEMTLNLLGPIVVNADLRKARQIVLTDEAYTIRHRVFQEEQVVEKVAA